jgi:hypothetical protein
LDGLRTNALNRLEQKSQISIVQHNGSGILNDWCRTMSSNPEISIKSQQRIITDGMVFDLTDSVVLRIPADQRNQIDQPVDFRFSKTGEIGKSLLESAKLPDFPFAVRRTQYLVKLKLLCSYSPDGKTKKHCDVVGSEFLAEIPVHIKNEEPPVVSDSKVPVTIHTLTFSEKMKQHWDSFRKEGFNVQSFTNLMIRVNSDLF